MFGMKDKFGMGDNPVVAQLRELEQRATEAERRAGELRRERDELQTRLDAIYQRTPLAVSEEGKRHQDMERLLVLAGLSKDDPLWKTVLSYADEHERNEAQTALAPGLSDGERQYNAGRAASASDFASALRDLRVKAVIESAKQKK